MDSPAIIQMRDVVQSVRTVADNVFENRVAHFNLFDGVTDTQAGFGISTGPGLGMVLANVTDYDVDGWYLQFCGAISYGAPASIDIVNWVNSRNRNTLAGKYYVALSTDGTSCAVAWEAHLWCRLVDSSMFQQQTQVQLRNLIQIMEYLRYAASQEAPEFQKVWRAIAVRR